MVAREKLDYNDAVWVATALMTYEKFSEDDTLSIEKMYFEQKDIVNRANELSDKKDRPSRPYRECCADHSKHSNNYLRAGNGEKKKLRRLTMPSEFQDKTYPKNIPDSYMFKSNSGRKISFHELLDFVKNEYTELLTLSIQDVETSTTYSYSKPREWIIPCNTAEYDIFGALKELKRIDWKQSKQMNEALVGDLIYIYCKSLNGEGSICFKGAIISVNKKGSEVDDSIYSAGGIMTIDIYFELAMFREYELEDDLTYSKLKAAGLESELDEPILVSKAVAEYLHMCDEKQRRIDRIDGTIPDTCLYPFPISIQEIKGNRESSVALDDTHTYEEKTDHALCLREDELRILAIQQSTDHPNDITSTEIKKKRSPYVAEYAKARAHGLCQLCGDKAPFKGKNGQPYLESHHIIWLADGGADSIDNTVALCPNCHRKMHVVKDMEDIAKLKKAVR